MKYIYFIAIIFCIIVLIEVVLYFIISYIREQFQWLITKKRDTMPEIDKEKIMGKYLKQGYDSILGWTRKPNTEGYDLIFNSSIGKQGEYKKSKWTINNKGARTNPNNEGLDDSIISCYGDSFAFGRQVNDDETWEHELSNKARINILNFGVGNYGMDQAILKLEKEFNKNPTKIVIIGVVPDTISRVMSYWKHFYEYGNIWAFKPKFELDKHNNLKLIPNLIDNPNKFFELEKFIPLLKEQDYFYENKFKQEIIGFPYIYYVLKNARRNLSIILSISKQRAFAFILKKRIIAKPEDWSAMNIIRRKNLEWAVRLYNTPEAVELMKKLVERFIEDGKRLNFTPVFVFLPQKNEMLYNSKIMKYNDWNNKQHFYNDFLNKIKDKIITIDVTTQLLTHPNLDSLYSEASEYGAHYSKKGNALVGQSIYKELKKRGLI